MTPNRSSDPILFFSKKETQAIIQAIQKAERTTSGEIRVHVARKIPGDPLDHAKQLFEKLRMTNTRDRNGVLILFGVKSRRFVILGDSGINQVVPDKFWADVVSLMGRSFSEDRFADGLTQAIGLIGSKLQQYFPIQNRDLNELPDEISYSL